MQSIEQNYLTPEHKEIFEKTKHIPGWQLPGDSFKLYEMAYHSGDVILEIGTFGGRSAIVELCGALANQNRQVPPQFFGVEIEVGGIWRTFNSLREADLEKYALLFHGNLEQLVETFPVQPTMVFVDGDHRYEGVKRDLEILSRILSPGTPVLCHDYTNPGNESGDLGVRQAVNEFVESGFASLEGTFGCSAFLITSDTCRGEAKLHPSWSEFLEMKAKNLEKQGWKLFVDWCRKVQDLEDSHSRQQAVKDIRALETELRQKKQKVKQLKGRVSSLKKTMNGLRSEIRFMKNSRFWKLRNFWFGLKTKISND